MSKNSHNPKKSTPKQLPILIFIGVLALVGAVVFLPSVFAQRNPTIQVISPDTYQTDFLQPAQSHFLLDVRTLSEFASGHISGATNINVDDLANRLSQVPKDVPVVIYCRSGNRSAIAANILAEAGYTQIYDLGGILEWQRQSLPIEQ